MTFDHQHLHTSGPLLSPKTETPNPEPHPQNLIPNPESRIPKVEIWSQYPRTRTPKPKTRDPNSETRNPNPESRKYRSRANTLGPYKPESRIPNPESTGLVPILSDPTENTDTFLAFQHTSVVEMKWVPTPVTWCSNRDVTYEC